MKAATAAEMQNIDIETINAYGIPGSVLMERAALAVVQRIVDRFPAGSKALVVCGPGNNGGDGLAVARELFNRGYRARAIIIGKKGKLSPDCMAQYETARKFGTPVGFSQTLQSGDLHGAFVVDALFGTGLKKAISGAFESAIETINSSGCPVISVDIASGISSDTAEVMGAAIHADITVTFGALKRGHLLYPGAGHSGEVFVHDIGFPHMLMNTIKCNVLTPDDAWLLLPTREPDSHKGDHGHLLVIAGSRGKTGAAFMAAEAALRTGAGLVTLGAPETLADIYMARATEAMTLPLPCTPGGAFAHEALDDILEFANESASAIAIGPGLGMEDETRRLVEDIVINSTVPVILDADGINALGDRATSILGKTHSPVVLTPHPGEFSRISGMSSQEIQANRPEAALAFAQSSGAYIALKGSPTVIAGPEGELFINSTGGPALAKGGSGDVLTGIAGAYAAMGLSPLEAALLGVHVHGMAGDLASESLNEHAVLASDVTACICEALNALIGEE